MKPNFAVIRERLDGAESDYAALSREVMTAFQSYGNVVSFGFKREPNSDRVLVFINEAMSIPPDWGRRTAHVLYDVRSALDHLVQELYVASHRRKPPLAISEQLAFPICTKKAAWADASRQGAKKPSRLEGVNKRFIDVIRRHQPFRKFRARHALARLRTYNDLDKHRRPYVVLFAPVDLRIAYKALAGCRIIDTHQYRLGRVIKIGTRLARLRIAEVGESKECVGVHLQGQLKVALDRGVLVEDLLAKVIAEARWIVHDCEAVL
jgi:hypothetical protein